MLGTGGDYIVDGGGAQARMAFLAAVDRVAPEVIRDVWARADTLVDHESIAAWCRRRGFTADWLATAVRGTAGFAREAARDGLDAGPPSKGDVVACHWTGFAVTTTWLPRFPAITWNPLREPEAAFRSRIEDYIATAKQTHGLVRAARKRVGAGEDPLRDFKWLALYQVKRWTIEQIADKANSDTETLDVKAVQKAIRVAADQAGITLADRRGRPAKQNPT
jgi:hypothetical protein